MNVEVNHTPLIEVGDTVTIAGWGSEGKTHHTVIRYGRNFLVVELESSRVRYEFVSIADVRKYFATEKVIEILRHNDYKVSIQKL